MRWIADCEMNSMDRHHDIEQIKAIIAEKSERYLRRNGEVRFAGVEGSTVKIAPAGFCWQ